MPRLPHQKPFLYRCVVSSKTPVAAAFGLNDTTSQAAPSLSVPTGSAFKAVSVSVQLQVGAPPQPVVPALSNAASEPKDREAVKSLPLPIAHPTQPVAAPPVLEPVPSSMEEDSESDNKHKDQFDTEELLEDLMETSTETLADPQNQAEPSAPSASAAPAPPVAPEEA